MNVGIKTVVKDGSDGGEIVLTKGVDINFGLKELIFSCWLVSLTVLIIVMLFRAGSTDDYQVGVVDGSKILEDARSFITERAKYPELVEIEVVEFAQHIQREMDALVESGEVDLIVRVETFLSGESVDYTGYVFLNAKDAYEKALETRTDYAGVRSLPRTEKVGGLLR